MKKTIKKPSASGEKAVYSPLQPLPNPLPKGVSCLQNPIYNKGAAFTLAEREALSLQGLLPPRVYTPDEQVLRILSNFNKKPNDLERYIHMMGLQDRNETLFYKVVMDHIEEMMPIIYTPTVGRACQEYGSIFSRPRGIYISSRDRGRVKKILRNWQEKNVRMIVVTDGERILGLGDLGAQGMGIPIGKLALYTACAGIHPQVCLPITIDVGTNNETLLRDSLYTGLREPRLRGERYDELIEEFVQAVQEVFPKALIQFEDFGNQNAFRLLEKYQDKVCCFNDDIQGTAAVAAAGLFSVMGMIGSTIQKQRLLFLGAGEAGIGIAELFVEALAVEGVDREVARHQCWFMDSKGLIVRGRDNLTEQKLPFAHEHPACTDLLAAVEALKPTALIGVSGMPSSFTKPVVEAMARINKRPVIFALSNPTSKAECTASDAYTWSDGQAIFASGSPFGPVVHKGQTFVPGQGNNAYIFPGVGLGVAAVEARHVTQSMFLVAARALACQVDKNDLKQGRIYPSLKRIQEVSAHIAVAVAEEAYRLKLAAIPRPKNLPAYIASMMYKPEYPMFA
jgi:malate dehydrogenase (oxaloacetate-decarboxylating)(NADP+)